MLSLLRNKKALKYHPGSANWITDHSGQPVQYIHYAPYGELIDNQAWYGYDERWKFTGKERDKESGYDYLGARFLWSNIGIRLSVDPNKDKGPNNKSSKGVKSLSITLSTSQLIENLHKTTQIDYSTPPQTDSIKQTEHNDNQQILK